MANNLFTQIVVTILLLVTRRCVGRPSVTLQPVLTLPTAGCAGIRVFRIADEWFMGVANFWDGTSKRSTALSQLYQLSLRHDDVTTPLELTGPIQEFTTHGAHGIDFFSTPAVPNRRNYTFMTLPNYYGCGSARGAAAEDCESTHIYRLRGSVDINSVLDAFGTNQSSRSTPLFKTFQKLATAGPAQTNHIVTPNGDVYLIVGENFNHEVCLYRLQAKGHGRRRQKHQWYFMKHQCLPTHGAGAVAVVLIDEVYYLITSAYHNSKTGWNTSTAVYAAKGDGARESKDGGRGLRFSKVHNIPTRGCHDADVLVRGAAVYVLLANDRESTASSDTNSTLLVFDRLRKQFVPVQEFPSKGAHGGDVFVGPDQHVYVMIANFGDRLQHNVIANSTLWRQVSRTDEHAPFELAAQIPTYGATDASAFSLDDGRRVFLSVANEGDIKSRRHQQSVVYEVLVDSL